MRQVQQLLIALLVGALSILSTVRPARAEFWASHADELLRSATRIEIVRVTALRAGVPEYVVEQSLRGTRPVGTVDRLVQGFFARELPAPGQRALLICDSSECPRAFAVDHAGAWALTAQEPGDGAAVMPPVVEDASMRAMAAGRSAPELCIRLDMRFAQSSAPAPPIEVRAHAGNGHGTATGPLLGGPQTVDFGIAHGSEGDVDFSLTTRPSRNPVTFHGHLTGRAPDGCLLADAQVERPVARTPAELTARFSGSTADAVIAQGTFRPLAGVARMSAPTPVSLSSRGGSELSLRFGGAVGSGVEESVALIQYETGSIRIGFHHGPTSATYPALILEVPRAAGLRRASATTAVLEALRPGQTVQWHVLFNASGSGTVPAGEMELTAVAP